jgi:hypothetical protein
MLTSVACYASILQQFFSLVQAWIAKQPLEPNISCLGPFKSRNGKGEL